MSLLEVLVASTILGLVVSALMVLLSTGIRLDTLNDEMRQARLIAKEEIEDPARHFLENPVAGVAVLDGLALDAVPTANPKYFGIAVNANVAVAPRNVTIGRPGIPVVVPCMRVSATVGWTDNDHAEQSLVLRKLVTQIQ